MSDRIDILCLCTPHGVGGVQNNAGRLTRAFRERGYIAQLGFLFEREPDYRPGVEDYFVVAQHEPTNAYEWWDFLRQSQQQIGSRRPHVTIGFSPLANIIGATMAGWQGRFVSRQAWPSDQQGRGTEAMEALLFRTPLINRNIAVSRFVASTFGHRGANYGRKTEVVYNEPPSLPQTEDDIEACRQEFAMPLGTRILGCLGRLHEQKNFQLAIRALAFVPDAHLYIAGGGPQESMLRKLAADVGVDARTHFLGPLQGADVTRFYRAVDLLLMPSLYEGHPMVMLEAMSAGAPVVAHDVAVMREAGSAATRYASSEPEDWARVINGINEQKRQEMIVGGRQRAEHFAKKSMVDEYLRVAGLPPFKGGRT